MTKSTDAPPPEWNLGDWEKALTIRVGTAHVCRQCGNLAMVTRGGVGVMELRCCGHAMDEEHIRGRSGKGGL